eukprot:g20337.t1
MSTYDVDAYPTPGGEEWVAPLLRQNELDKKRLQKKPIVPVDLEELRQRVCKVLAGGAGHPDSDDDSSSSSSSRSSSSEDEDEEAPYKNGVDDRFGKKSMPKVPIMKDKGHGLRFAPVANTPNLYWKDGKKKVERDRKRNKSGTTMKDPEKYTGWNIQYNQNKKPVHKFIGLKKYLPRNPNKKPEKADMERREAMRRSMGDAKIARGLLMGFSSERARFKLANKVVGVSYNKFRQKSGYVTKRYLGRIKTGKFKPSTKNKTGRTALEQRVSGNIRRMGLPRAFQKCKIWRKKKERARDAKKVIKKHRMREKLWSRRNDIELGKLLDLRYAARAILLRERTEEISTGRSVPWRKGKTEERAAKRMHVSPTSFPPPLVGAPLIGVPQLTLGGVDFKNDKQRIFGGIYLSKHRGDVINRQRQGNMEKVTTRYTSSAPVVTLLV